MAGITSIPGIEVTLQANGRTLQGYPHLDVKSRQHQSPITVARYFESVPGAPFSIQILTKRPYEFTSSALFFQIEIDGVLTTTSILKKSTYEQMGKRFQMSVDRSQQGTAREIVYSTFKFKELPVTDDIKLANPCYGTIVVKVFAKGAIRGAAKIIKPSKGKKVDLPIIEFRFEGFPTECQSAITPRTPIPRFKPQPQSLTPAPQARTITPLCLPLTPPFSVKRERREDEYYEERATKRRGKNQQRLW